MATDRKTHFDIWLIQQLTLLTKQNITAEQIQKNTLTGDAGFRQYFRITLSDKQSFIAVDAPPKLSNNVAFFELAKLLETNHVRVPKVWSFDKKQGFLLIEDLGNVQFFDVLSQTNTISWYHKAIDELIKINSIPYSGIEFDLPDYDDAFVLTELSIFSEWLVEKYLGITITSEQSKMLEASFSVLVNNVSVQPKVVMHRDYHSRNLMVDDEQISVIDFQDAVHGAITYDIASLLRDCYKKLSTNEVSMLFDYFVLNVSKNEHLSSLTQSYDKSTWLRWFDLMGMQRHIKASGIFARLALRDNKCGYLNDIPLTLDYLVEVSSHYQELEGFGSFIRETVLPEVLKKQ